MMRSWMRSSLVASQMGAWIGSWVGSQNNGTEIMIEISLRTYRSCEIKSQIFLNLKKCPRWKWVPAIIHFYPNAQIPVVLIWILPVKLKKFNSYVLLSVAIRKDPRLMIHNNAWLCIMIVKKISLVILILLLDLSSLEYFIVLSIIFVTLKS